jgi:hypothetical protein
MRLTVLAATILSAVLLVPGAFADKPDKERVPIGTHTDYPAGAVCPADSAPGGVSVTLVGGNEALHFFADGRFLATGLHVVQFTNIADPDHSVTLDVHGSFSIDPQPDGSANGRGSGTTAFTFFPGDAGPGDTKAGRIYFFTGNIQLTFDPSGAVASFQSTQQPQDVCAMIAS